jgi:uncharacterized protein (DUF2062 family)
MIDQEFFKLKCSLAKMWKREQIQQLWADVLYIVVVAGAVFGVLHQLLIEFSHWQGR